MSPSPAALGGYAVRPIRPSDAPLLVHAYEHELTPESRHARFHGGGPHLPSTVVHYLTHVDGVDHVALVAIEAGSVRAGLGVARFVRLRDRPREAELAVAVIDRAQRHGVGACLVRALAAMARARRIDTFTMLVLEDNHRVRHILETLGAHARRDGGEVTYTLDVEALLAPHSSSRA